MHTNSYAVTVHDSRPEMPEVDAQWIERTLIESQGKFPTRVMVTHLGSDIEVPVMRAYKVTSTDAGYYDEFHEFAVVAVDEQDAAMVVQDFLADRQREYCASVEQEFTPDRDMLKFVDEHIVVEPVEDRGVIVAYYRHA